jgi:hypothetical protein
VSRLRCYVAAPYADAAYVRIVHATLEAHGIKPVSTWVERAEGVEDFHRLALADLRRIAQENDADVRLADVVLMLARKGAGGEMFAEARLALDLGKTVIWTGRLTLSSFRPGVLQVRDLDDAWPVLERMARASEHCANYRRRVLELAVGAP